MLEIAAEATDESARRERTLQCVTGPGHGTDTAHL